MVRSHQADQAFDAIVHIHVRAGLLAIAPDLNSLPSFELRDFARNRGRRLFLAAIIRAERPVHVVEAHDARLELVVVVVVAAELFREQLFPAITRLWIGRIRVFFLQRNRVPESSASTARTRKPKRRTGNVFTPFCLLASSMCALIRMLFFEMSARNDVM